MAVQFPGLNPIRWWITRHPPTKGQVKRDSVIIVGHGRTLGPARAPINPALSANCTSADMHRDIGITY